MLDIKWNPFIDNIIASCSEDTSVSRRGAPQGGQTPGAPPCFLLEASLPKLLSFSLLCPSSVFFPPFQLAPGWGGGELGKGLRERIPGIFGTSCAFSVISSGGVDFVGEN